MKPVATSTGSRKRADITLSKLRAAVTNGDRLLERVDHRSSYMRRLRDLIQAHNAQLGGPELMSESEQRLVRRCAMITLQLEMLDSKFASADGSASQIDLDTYQRLTNTLRRTLESLGLQRRAKPVQSLQDYLTAQAAE